MEIHLFCYSLLQHFTELYIQITNETQALIYKSSCLKKDNRVTKNGTVKIGIVSTARSVTHLFLCQIVVSRIQQFQRSFKDQTALIGLHQRLMSKSLVSNAGSSRWPGTWPVSRFWKMPISTSGTAGHEGAVGQLGAVHSLAQWDVVLLHRHWPTTLWFYYVLHRNWWHWNLQQYISTR